MTLTTKVVTAMSTAMSLGITTLLLPFLGALLVSSTGLRFRLCERETDQRLAQLLQIRRIPPDRPY
jgi:hypothetical protein